MPAQHASGAVGGGQGCWEAGGAVHMRGVRDTRRTAGTRGRHGGVCRTGAARPIDTNAHARPVSHVPCACVCVPCEGAQRFTCVAVKGRVMRVLTALKLIANDCACYHGTLRTRGHCAAGMAHGRSTCLTTRSAAAASVRPLPLVRVRGRGVQSVSWTVGTCPPPCRRSRRATATDRDRDRAGAM